MQVLAAISVAFLTISFFLTGDGMVPFSVEFMVSTMDHL